MALIKFKVDTAGTNPKVVSDDVLNLHPGDRLFFEGDKGQQIFVDLSDPENALVALVKFKGSKPGDFEATQLADGSILLKLQRPGGDERDGDPPN